MPRKSNKTAHVLGLITNEKPAASPEEDESAIQNPKPNRKAVVRKPAPATMESQGDNNAKLAEEIRSKLLEEIDGPVAKSQEMEQKISNYHPYSPDANAQNLPHESVPMNSMPNNSIPDIDESLPMHPAPNTISHADNVPPVVKTVVADYPLEDFDAKEPVKPTTPSAPAMMPTPTTPSAPALMPTPTPNMSSTPALTPTPNTAAADAVAAHSPYVPPAHAPYIYINVLEELVKERTLPHMKTFDMCLCNRCVMDVIALALTRLPSKYVVVEKGEGIPLLNYYGAHFQIQVIAELTKACMTVKTSPHH